MPGSDIRAQRAGPAPLLGCSCGGCTAGMNPSAALQHHSPAVLFALFEILSRKVLYGCPSAGGIWGVPVSLVLSGLRKDCLEQHFRWFFITSYKLMPRTNQEICLGT